MERGSWLLIESGMTVRGRNDEDLGTVGEVVGESSADIFRGVTLSHGLFSQNVFIPEDRIRAVEDSAVYVDLSAEEARQLKPAGAEPATGAASAVV